MYAGDQLHLHVLRDGAEIDVEYEVTQAVQLITRMYCLRTGLMSGALASEEGGGPGPPRGAACAGAGRGGLRPLLLHRRRPRHSASLRTLPLPRFWMCAPAIHYRTRAPKHAPSPA